MIIVTKNWNNYLSKLEDFYQDVYFYEEYLKLYISEKDSTECFIYSKNEFFLLFPYLKRENNLFGESFFDFESQYGYSGPLANTFDNDFLTEAQNHFVSYCRENNFIAGFTRFHPLIGNDKFFGSIGDVIDDRFTIAIDLTLPEKDIWENEFHSKHRNVIRKAESIGLEFMVDTDYKYLNEFIDLYRQTMNKVEADKYYYFNADYYHKFKESIPQSFLGLVWYENKIVSASLFFYSKNYGHYHLSGSDINYLQFYPNNFLIFKTALYLKSLGVKSFHLGGGTDSDLKNSLFKFKERFSKTKQIFKIGKSIFNQEKYQHICDCWNETHNGTNVLHQNILLKYRY